MMNATRAMIVVLGLIWTGCTYYENETMKLPPLPQPKVSKPTTTLQAAYVTTAPDKVTSTYWKTADYLPIVAQDLITGQVPGDAGLYNVSGTFNGLSDFNLGKDPKITMKAAYDNTNLYILVTWRDTTFNSSSANWFYNGPSDPHKAGSTTGWTSQASDDKLFLSFDMGSLKRDVWNWSLALSEPMGYAIDMLEDNSVASVDAGNKTFVRNDVGIDNVSGPKYQWNESQQELTRTYGGLTILDPGFYILDLNKTDFVGDAVSGDVLFQNNCAECHGIIGDGNGTNYQTGVAFNIPGKMNRYTRTGLVNFASDVDQHEGASHFLSLSETERDDVFARLRSFSGIPGYYLQNPGGSNSDVHTLSNVVLAKIDGKNSKGYSVLFIRALNTSNPDDIVFNPSVGQYSFNVLASDNDDLNRIGENNNQLIFKPKQ